jgi:hypothetical protein
MRSKAVLAVVVALAVLLPPGTAGAADSAYWTNGLSGKISHANLDGSGGGKDLGTPEVTPEIPTGVAIDATRGRIYWADRGSEAIYYASLDGGGAGKLLIGSATVDQPFGVAIDPATSRLYWANSGANTISYANLDGSGGGDLYTTGLSGATLEEPRGLAIDPATNRVYWANYGGATISSANLDGTGKATDLDTSGATVERPTGLAIAGGRIYWTNAETPKGIFYANLSGGNGGELDSGDAEASGAMGIAIDSNPGKVFWAEDGPPDAISYASLDGSPGGALDTAGATLEGPSYVALLRAPQAAPTLRVPEISGQHLIDRPLYCSQGAWMADLPGSFLYRAPQAFSYGWLRNGEAIQGANEARYLPTKPGAYDCRVTATNAAGSTAQTSADLALERGYAYATGFAPVHGRRALLTLTCTGDGRCKGLVKLIAHVGYHRVVHRDGRRVVIRRRALFPVGKASFSIFPGRTKVVQVKLKRKGKRLLLRRTGRRMRVRLLGRDIQHRGLLLKAGGRSTALARRQHGDRRAR